MKDGLENIDEIFKQTFDGFEADVDPNVWNNVQNSINSGGATPQIDPSSVAGIASKTMALKIVAGVALLGTVATSVYFIPKFFQEETNNTIVENVVTEDVTKEQPILDNTIELTEINEVNSNTEEIIEESNSTDNVSVITNKTERNTNQNNSESTIDTPPQTDPGATKEAPVVSNEGGNDDEDNSKPQLKEKLSTKKETVVVLDITINVDKIKGTAPLTVQFDAIGNADKYFWDFSDGSPVLVEESPVYTFQEEGTYRVKVTGIDKTAETKSDYIDIIVEKDYSSSLHPLQNIFTPNGDGENDFVKVRGKNIDRITVQIADSKGKPVYFMDSLDDIWDGKDQNGNFLPQGQYYMVVVAIGTDGKKHVQKTAINLNK